jgi:hypothetical protein
LSVIDSGSRGGAIQKQSDRRPDACGVGLVLIALNAA